MSPYRSQRILTPWSQAPRASFRRRLWAWVRGVPEKIRLRRESKSWWWALARVQRHLHTTGGPGERAVNTIMRAYEDMRRFEGDGDLPPPRPLGPPQVKAPE